MLLSLASCASRAPAPPAPPAPLAQPAEPELPPPPVVHEPAPNSPRFLDAIPAELAPELAQQIGFLSDICNVAMRYESAGAHRIHVGCRTCPPFEGAGAVSDGRIAVDGPDFYELELYVPGHFTAANADQRLAVFRGCKPHAANFGGTLIAERTGDKYRSLRYISGVRPQACQAYRRADGRDIAVCEFTDTHQSISTDTLSVLDFSIDPPKDQTLLSFTNQDPCATAKGTRTVEEGIESFELNQNPAAKNNGLIVRTTRTPRTMDPAYERYCAESPPGAEPVERPFSKPQVSTRQYRFDGQGFIPR